MTFGFYAIIFFSLKMLTLPDINHNVPLCWLLVIGRKGVSSCATTQLGFDGRPPQGLPFWFPLTEFCSSIVFVSWVVGGEGGLNA